MRYTVMLVESQRDYTTKHGPRVSYKLTLRNLAGQEESGVELNQKPETAAPKPGDIIEGDVDRTSPQAVQWGPILKKAYNPLQDGGSTQSSNGTTGGDDEAPERQHRIVRQHSQTAALQTLRLAHELGLDVFTVDGETAIAALLKLHKRLADHYDNDVSTRVAERMQEYGEPPVPNEPVVVGGTDVPVAAPPPVPVPVVADDIPF